MKLIEPGLDGGTEWPELEVKVGSQGGGYILKTGVVAAAVV